MSKETLTPWRYYPQYSEIVDRHGCRVGLVGDEERAETILKAVDNYERLVKALKRIENECLCGPASRRSNKIIKIQSIAQQLLTDLKQQ